MQTNKKFGRLKSLSYLLKMIKSYRLKMILCVITGIWKEIATIGAAGLAAYMAALAYQGTFTTQADTLFKWLIFCMISCGVMYYLEMFLSHDVAYHIIVDFRLALYHAFEKICPEVLLKNRSGQLAVTLMNDVEMTESFFGHTLGMLVVAAVITVVDVCFLFWIHPILSICVIVSSILIMIVPFIFSKQADLQGEQNRFILGEADSVTLEGINGMKELLTLNAKERYKEKNHRFMNKLTENQVAYAKRQGLEGTFLQLAVGIAAMSVTIAAFYLLIHGQISLEWFIVCAVISWSMYNPLVEISSIARTFGLIFGACERMFQVLESEPLVQDSGKDIDISQLESDIVFDNVCFKYAPDLEDAVHNISFHIKSGETVALVGASGAGKTTCMNLLMRLWDISSGSIKIGGVDIRDMSLDNIHTITSAVLQDVYLFNTTVRENLRIGNVNASDEEVEAAAKYALAHQFIMDLPEGYDTVTGERGVSLSGGQRQRLAIARALLKESPILIFDEAVSNLDTMSEQEIQHTIKNISKNKTMLMVAHRLSTIKMADWLIVLKDGEVAEIGTHEELLSRDSYYKELLASQLS